MDNKPTVSMNIHGAPVVAVADDGTSSFALSCSTPYYAGTHVTFFCRDASLARKLADAVNAVIFEHLAARQVLAEAAE